MYSYLDSLELEHYGILGMKWGVRRTPEQLGHRKTEKLKKYKQKKLKILGKNEERMLSEVNEAIKKHPGSMTLKEIQKQLNDYVKKEKVEIDNVSYKDMQKDTIKRGALAAGSVMALAGGTAVTAASIVSGVPSPIMPIAWLGGVGGGLAGLAASVVKPPALDKANRLAENGKGWIGNAYDILGEKKILEIDKKLKKKLSKLTPSEVINAELRKKASRDASAQMQRAVQEMNEDISRIQEQMVREQNDIINRQIQQDIQRQINDTIQQQINMQIQNQIQMQTQQMMEQQAMMMSFPY